MDFGMYLLEVYPRVHIRSALRRLRARLAPQPIDTLRVRAQSTPEHKLHDIDGAVLQTVQGV